MIRLSPATVSFLLPEFRRCESKLHGPYVYPTPTYGVQHRALEEFVNSLLVILGREADALREPKGNTLPNIDTELERVDAGEELRGGGTEGVSNGKETANA